MTTDVPAPAGFTVKPVVNRNIGQIKGTNTIGLVLHVQAGNDSPYGWFNAPRAQASSTWWAGKKGEREQYGNPDSDKFWAQADGNRTYHSCETEGLPAESLTAAQIESVAVAFAWGVERYGWKPQTIDTPGQSGLGWHGMGGARWGNHPFCPGELRKAQRTGILQAALNHVAATGHVTTPVVTKKPPILARVIQKITRSAVAVDGRLGTSTIRQWQKVMRTPQDGVISRPSSLVRAVQVRVGFKGSLVDGVLGPRTWEAIQRHLGVVVDGIPGPLTIKALQKRLNSGQF